MAKKEVKLDLSRFGKYNEQHITELSGFKDAEAKAQKLHALLLEGKDDRLKDKAVVMTGWR